MTERDRNIAALRAFNRLYTLRLGLLDAHLDGSAFTLSEARILYELAHRESPTAAEIARALKLDRAQMSRTLKRFADRGLLAARDNPSHGRQQFLSLTPDGRSAFDALDAAHHDVIGDMLDQLGPIRCHRLTKAATVIADVLRAETAPMMTFRSPEPGDLGLIVHRQMQLYAAEYGYDGSYEILIARILADFEEQYDPAHDAAWVADIDGQVVGSVFLTCDDQPATARLRLLYVEPDARGSGLGRQLIEACVEKARALDYRRIVLWTDQQLSAARRLYERAGFRRTEAVPAEFFGQLIVSETWSMEL